MRKDQLQEYKGYYKEISKCILLKNSDTKKRFYTIK